jgi:copper resistance protein B
VRSTLLALALVAAPAWSADPDTHHDMRGHMGGDARVALLLLDRLEIRDTASGSQFAWKADAWFGSDFNKLLLRTEGEAVGGRTERAEMEALWLRPTTRWWDLVAGVRHDFRPRDSRTWLALGVVGLAPYGIHVQATGYVGEDWRTALRLEGTYELLLTNRLIIQPRVELNAHGKDDAGREIGSGVSDLDLGLRLRYEIRREVAPYVGVAWVNRFGGTADAARARGEDAHEVQVLAGLRVWY